MDQAPLRESHRSPTFVARFTGDIMKTLPRVIAAFLASVALGASAQPIPLVGLAELSGPGASSGTHFRDGMLLAAKEINAAGGILGRPVALTVGDTQSSPGVAKSLATKAVDDDALAVIGPVFSGSVLVSSDVMRQAEVPNIVGGEATAITQRGNAYVFRTSFSQANAMPKVGRYIAEDIKAKRVALTYVNNDFGKGGRDALLKDLQARGVQVVADIPTESGQVDFSSVVVKVRQAQPDLLFAYYTVDESARLLIEARKQGLNLPIIGETTIMQQSVITLAGAAANGVKGHVGLTIDAPNPLVQAFSQKFEREYKYKSSHEGIKGYTAIYVLKAAAEKAGKLDRKAIAQSMKNLKLSAKEHPGVLLDVSYDDKGDISRESYMVEVREGKQVVVKTMPAQ
jgi:branched-chain amino acid transport system substrate-binding protein